MFALQIVRLHGYDAFLRQALSSKGVDIRKREAEALRARIERELVGKNEKIRTTQTVKGHFALRARIERELIGKKEKIRTTQTVKDHFTH